MTTATQVMTPKVYCELEAFSTFNEYAALMVEGNTFGNSATNKLETAVITVTTTEAKAKTFATH